MAAAAAAAGAGAPAVGRGRRGVPPGGGGDQRLDTVESPPRGEKRQAARDQRRRGAPRVAGWGRKAGGGAGVMAPRAVGGRRWAKHGGGRGVPSNGRPVAQERKHQRAGGRRGVGASRAPAATETALARRRDPAAVWTLFRHQTRFLGSHFSTISTRPLRGVRLDRIADRSAFKLRGARPPGVAAGSHGWTPPAAPFGVHHGHELPPVGMCSRRKKSAVPKSIRPVPAGEPAPRPCGAVDDRRRERRPCGRHWPRHWDELATPPHPVPPELRVEPCIHRRRRHARVSAAPLSRQRRRRPPGKAWTRTRGALDPLSGARSSRPRLPRRSPPHRRGCCARPRCHSTGIPPASAAAAAPPRCARHRRLAVRRRQGWRPARLPRPPPPTPTPRGRGASECIPCQSCGKEEEEVHNIRG